MTALIYLTGIAVFALVIYLTLELAPAAPTGRLSEILTPADGVILTRWRESLSPLDKPVSRWTPTGFLRKTRANLYWAHIGDRWNDWNEVQFTSLRVALAVAGFGLGMVATAEPVFALVGGLVGFQYPAMSMGGVARRYRRQFIAQLPEFVQLVSAQMSANVSMEEALRRTAQAQSLVGRWMRWVLQMAKGRDLIKQMQREAQESHLPELIGMSVQLEFIPLILPILTPANYDRIHLISACGSVVWRAIKRSSTAVCGIISGPGRHKRKSSRWQSSVRRECTSGISRANAIWISTPW